MSGRHEGAPDCAGRNGAHTKKRDRIAHRYNEQVGGGYFVFARGGRTGRIKTGSIMAGNVPFEHPTLESAAREAERLSKIHKRTFYVFEQVAGVYDA